MYLSLVSSVIGRQYLFIDRKQIKFTGPVTVLKPHRVAGKTQENQFSSCLVIFLFPFEWALGQSLIRFPLFAVYCNEMVLHS